MSLVMRDIWKSFSANQVLKGVDLSLASGEVRALIGENGAGKTTLMNILGGVLQPDRGEIELDGRVARFLSPRDSINAGIAFIHQELNLAMDLSVCENLFLGRELRRGGLLDRAGMDARAKAILNKLQIPLDCTALVRSLDASYKQVVEIARALLFNAKIIIMDEPTTSLTEMEIERVFGIIRTVAAQGVSIIYISHKLGEVREICETYTVLRDGMVAAQGAAGEATELELARHMVGHEVRAQKLSRRENIGDVALEANGLTRAGEFENASFTVRAGEILGFTGLLGDGRSELFRTIFGVTRPEAGEIRLFGKKTRVRDTSGAYRLGIGYVPRDRKENGILKDMSILENASIVTLRELTKLFFIDERRERDAFIARAGELSIKFASPDELITSLSGGNQQKVVLAKWLSAKPRVMIFDNPTQGVDVGAKEEIYDIILRLAESGVAIIILSSEAREIIRLCDRVMIMYHGHIQGELAGREATEQNIMVLATGGCLK